jgi:hypothetical protein
MNLDYFQVLHDQSLMINLLPAQCLASEPSSAAHNLAAKLSWSSELLLTGEPDVDVKVTTIFDEDVVELSQGFLTLSWFRFQSGVLKIR